MNHQPKFASHLDNQLCGNYTLLSESNLRVDKFNRRKIFWFKLILHSQTCRNTTCGSTIVSFLEFESYVRQPYHLSIAEYDKDEEARKGQKWNCSANCTLNNAPSVIAQSTKK